MAFKDLKKNKLLGRESNPTDELMVCK